MTATSFQVWGPLFLAAIVTAVMTPLAVWFAPKIGAMDIPKDSRRVHNKPMPRFGGAAIYIGMMVSLSVFALNGRGVLPIMIGCTIVYALGLIDDLTDMKPIIKFAGQLLAATVVFAMGVRITFVKITIIDLLFTSGHPILFGNVIDYIVTVLWLVAITNAVNLIDGLDGLAAGIAAISALCIAYVAYIHGYELPTLLMMAVIVLAIVASFWSGMTIAWSILVWFMVGFSLLSYINSLLQVKIIHKFMPEEEEEIVSDLDWRAPEPPKDVAAARTQEVTPIPGVTPVSWGTGEPAAEAAEAEEQPEEEPAAP